ASAAQDHFIWIWNERNEDLGGVKAGSPNGGVEPQPVFVVAGNDLRAVRTPGHVLVDVLPQFLGGKLLPVFHELLHVHTQAPFSEHPFTRALLVVFRLSFSVIISVCTSRQGSTSKT